MPISQSARVRFDSMLIKHRVIIWKIINEILQKGKWRITWLWKRELEAASLF